MARQYIHLFGGRRIGSVEEDSSGNKLVYNEAGQIISRYNKSLNTTYDFYGHIIAFGDVATGFLLKGHI